MPDSIKNKNSLSRRDFIKRSAVGVIAGSAALSSFNLAAFANSPAAKGILKISNEDIVVKLSDNASLGTVGGSVKINDELMLIRRSDTSFIALKTVCTHKGCDVELEGDKFICPCHGSEYTLDGKVTLGPAEKDLKSYQTTFDPDKGTVTIQLGSKTDK
jgi:cytochrome b6-f complex iron-sulfur subunit